MKYSFSVPTVVEDEEGKGGTTGGLDDHIPLVVGVVEWEAAGGEEVRAGG